MPVHVRRAVKEDCPRLMELITELAVYEKAPDDVTVTLDHFVESGFGEKPIWWAFVAEEDGSYTALPYTISATLPGKGKPCTLKI